MKRQKASNIYFAATHFTVQCTCSEKIHIFTFKVKIDHQSAHYLSGPTATKTKMVPPISRSLERCICAEDRGNGSAKEKGTPASHPAAVEALTQVVLKQQKQHNSVDPISIQLHDLFRSQGQAP